MKVIFLDIDGVLNSSLYMAQQAGGMKNLWDVPGFTQMIDPRAVALLEDVVQATGARIVISSSWKYGHTPEQIQGYLRQCGFTGEVIGQTPNSTNDYRAVEIAGWLGEHKQEVETYAIIDDADIQGFDDHFVHTSFSMGMQQEHAEKLKKILTPV